MARTFDVLIIGGGVIGSSIAYHVARQGQSVLVIDQSEGALAPAASWASAGGVRRQGRHPAEAALASVAIARWPTLEQELEADLHYRQGGNLLLAETDAEAEELVEFVRQQHENGFSDVRLLDRQELRDVFSDAAPHIVAASYSPADGQADPGRTTRAFAAAAQSLGAEYQFATPAIALQIGQQRVRGVLTPHETVYAEQIVLAAGAWSQALAASIGLHLPLRTRALQMLLSTPAPSQTLQPVLGTIGRHLSLKQLNNGAFLLGGGWPGEVIETPRGYQLRQESIEGNWADACVVLPAVAKQQIASAWCGLEAHSIDDIPFVGTTSAYHGLILATGFSGHGFAISPAIGQSVARLLAGEATSELDGLSPERISKFAYEDIAAFIHEKT